MSESYSLQLPSQLNQIEWFWKLNRKKYQCNSLFFGECKLRICMVFNQALNLLFTSVICPQYRFHHFLKHPLNLIEVMSTIWTEILRPLSDNSITTWRKEWCESKMWGDGWFLSLCWLLTGFFIKRSRWFHNFKISVCSLICHHWT